MTTNADSRDGVGRSTELTRDAIGTPGIVFLVLAALAPVTAIAIAAGLGIAFGNGGGLAGTFVLAGIVLLLFSIGYARMSERVVNAGAFYAYATRAFGRPIGLMTAFIAVLSYNSFTAGVPGTLASFAQGTFTSVAHIDLPWQVWAVIALSIVAIVGYRALDVSAYVLGVVLTLEALILIVLDVSIVVKDGISLAGLSPSHVFSGAVGIGFLFAFQAFVGFEATALFAEEAREPRKTIPRAIYWCVGIVTIFYGFTTLAIVSAVGTDAAQGIALKDPAGFVFAVSRDHLGTFLTDVMQFLLLLSLFAACLALHNSSTRYLFAMGRAGVLPRALGRTHEKMGSPYIASLTQSIFNVLVFVGFALAGADPFLSWATSMTGFATVGILFLQFVAAVSIVVFFRREQDTRWWSTAIAPGLGALGLLAACILAVSKFTTITGSESAIINNLPWLLVVAGVGGLLMAFWLRGARPDTYRKLGEDEWLAPERRTAVVGVADAAVSSTGTA